MRAIINCPCPSDYFGKKSHRNDCTEVCPRMVTKDRYSEPKRCNLPIKRQGLCARHAQDKERLEKKHALKGAIA